MQEIHAQAGHDFEEWQKKAREHDAQPAADKDGTLPTHTPNRHERRKAAAVSRRNTRPAKV